MNEPTAEQKRIAADFLRSLANPEHDQAEAFPAVADWLAPPEDPRVEVVARVYLKTIFGDRVTWDGSTCQDEYADHARTILAALDAMETAAPGVLSDKDGDTWIQNAAGTWDCPKWGFAGREYSELEVVYGPLERQS